MSDAPESPALAADTPAPAASPSPFAAGPERFHPVAGVAGLLLPGLGHVVLRQPRRAVAVALGVLGLFFGGLLVGGIDTIDSREDRLWFYVHAFVGPLTFAADWVNQNQFKAWAIDESISGRPQPIFRSAYPGEVRVVQGEGGALPYPQLEQLPQWGDGNVYQGRSGAGKSVGKVNEIALLMVALAGMMNLVAVLDALFNRRRPESELYSAGAAS
ncbi:MAG: hypothetical protein RIE77_14465 [Phycisphaerales bacterium]|jgi:hypothetical protein